MHVHNRVSTVVVLQLATHGHETGQWMLSTEAEELLFNNIIFSIIIIVQYKTRLLCVELLAYSTCYITIFYYQLDYHSIEGQQSEIYAFLSRWV